MLPAAPSQHPLDAHQAVSFLIAREGNAQLAAIDAARALQNPHITPPTLLAALSSDPSAVTHLASQTRVLVILKTLAAYNLMHTALTQAIAADKLPATSIAKTYTTLAASMATLSAPPPSQPPPDEFAAVLKRISQANPEVADAIESLIKQPSPADLPANEPSGSLDTVTRDAEQSSGPWPLNPNLPELGGAVALHPPL